MFREFLNDLEEYTDREDVVHPRPTTTHGTSFNGMRFTAEKIRILIDFYKAHTVEKIKAEVMVEINLALDVLDSFEAHPGLLQRHPRAHKTTLQAQDDYAARIWIESQVRAIQGEHPVRELRFSKDFLWHWDHERGYRYDGDHDKYSWAENLFNVLSLFGIRTVPGSFDNLSINGWTFRTWLGRMPHLKQHARFADERWGRLDDAITILSVSLAAALFLAGYVLLGSIFSAAVVIIFLPMIMWVLTVFYATVSSNKKHQDPWIQTSMLIETSKGKSFLTIPFEWLFNHRANKLWPQGWGECERAYFTFNHPLAKWSLGRKFK